MTFRSVKELWELAESIGATLTVRFNGRVFVSAIEPASHDPFSGCPSEDGIATFCQAIAHVGERWDRGRETAQHAKSLCRPLFLMDDGSTLSLVEARRKKLEMTA